MQPSETTPLLGNQKPWPSIYVDSSTHQSTSVVQDEDQRHRNCEDREALLVKHDVAPETGHLNSQAGPECTPEISPPGCGTALFLVLLFSLLISNLEGPLLLTTHAQVATDFGQYSQSQWLIVAYPLAVSAAEPIMGSLSNGIGRRPLLLISYIVFASAASVCGAAPYFSVFIIGRVMAGIGGSGMVAMVNLILADLVGLKDLATYRSYFQAAMASGRLLGGPVGGFLAERLGWRLVFVAQTPILLLAAILCAMLIPSVSASSSSDNVDNALSGATGATTGRRHQIWMALRHVDFGGAFLLVCTITLGLISFVFLGDGYAIYDSRVSLTLGLCLISGGLLYTVERHVVSKPMLSRRLLSNLVVVGIYLINVLGMTAQSSLTFILPLEDQILNSATADRAGLQLMPLVFGSICGSMVAGILIKRNHSLVKLASKAMVTTSLARIFMYFCWYSMGPVLRIFPLVVIGVSSSVTFASTFIFLNAQVTKTDQAMAVASLFCLYGIGSAVGTTSSKVIINSILRSKLTERLDDVEPNNANIITSLLKDHRLVHKLPEELKSTIQQSIKESFSASRAFSAAAQVAALPFLFFLQSYQKGVV